MTIKYYILSFFFCFCAFLGAQNSYDNLPLATKIRIKEGVSTYYSTQRVASGVPPVTFSSPEQDCNSALPVCQNLYTTTTSYSGVGNNDEIPSNSSCLGSNEKNSVWYTFNTSSAGNLAFQITPNNASNDYDFALYDITNNNCSGISSGAITPVRCNFAATAGATGLSSSGTNASEGAGGSNQSSVLATTAGRTYVLVINNYSASQSGYALNFGSGTASIFDNTAPTILGATASCGSNIISYTASEQIKCNSIATDGSDFTITGTGGPYVVSAARGLNCGVNTAQITLTISPALSGVGPWDVGVTTGSDGNSLLDACGNAMAAQTKSFTTTPAVPSITGPTSVCKGSNLALTASNGSSYNWTGSAVPPGQNTQQTISMVPNAGGTLNFTVQVTNGSCGTVPATYAVTVKEGPISDFNATSFTICAGSPITFNNTSTMPCTTFGSGVNICTCGNFGCSSTANNLVTIGYDWVYGDGTSHFATGAGVMSPTHTYATPGIYNVNLTSATSLGTGACSNSINKTVVVLPAPGTLTISPSVTICPGETTTLTVSGGTTYTWSPAATLGSPNADITSATPVSNTIYTVSTPGCASLQTATVSVNTNGTSPNIGAIRGPIAVCNNQTAITYSINNAATTYTWSAPAGVTITSALPHSNVITVDYGLTAGTISVSAQSICGTATATLNVGIGTSLPINVVATNTSICGGSTATLSATGATNYTWSPATSLSSASGSSVVANPTVTTVYTIDGATGTCLGSTTTTVNVLSNASLSVTATSTVICPAGTTTLIASGVTSYTWFPSATLNTSVGGTVFATPSANTTYTVIGSISSCTIAAQIAITVTTNPVVTVANSPTICSGGLAALNASGADSYSWTPNTGLSSSSGANVNANPSVSTTYTVTGTTLLGCKSNTTVAVAVISTPTVALIANPPAICITKSSTLTAAGATSYTWSPIGSLTTSTGNTTVASPNLSTIYTVIGANGTAPNVCSSSQTIQVVVLPNTVALASPATTICAGNTTALSASGGNTYVWIPNASAFQPNDPVTVVKPAVTTIYTVTASNNGLCPGTATVLVNVEPLPIINAGQDTTTNIDEYITLYGTGNTTVGFLSPDGTPLLCNFCPIVAINPQVNTCYTLKGESSFGCIAYDDVCVTVTTDWNVYIPNAFSPNDDPYNGIFVPTGYGISEIKLSVYDRWGVLLFKSNGDNIGWDGTYKGKLCQQDVYVYQADIVTMAGKKVKRTGHVTLLK